MVFKNIKRDLLTLTKGNKGYVELILMIYCKFNPINSQIWVNRSIKYTEWEQTQNIHLKDKKEGL